MLGKFKVPGFSYPGGKVRLRKWLVSMMPCEGGTYAEPFAGRGNVFWLAALALRFRRWWLNDPHTARFLRAISEVDVGAIPIKISKDAACKLSKEARTSTDALVLVLEPRVAYAGGTGGRVSSLSLTHRNMNSYKATLRCSRDILSKKLPRITSYDWQKCDLDTLKSHDFVYLDPPYMESNANYAIDTVDHEQLLRFLKSAKFRWLLSGYDTPLYRQVIGKPCARRSSPIWQKTVKPGATRHSRVECVWKGNY